MPQTISGRTFPDVGDEVVYLDANGYDYQREAARKIFVKDQILKVKHIDIGDCSSSIEFEEAPGKRFNSVMFELLADDVAPEEPEPELTTLQVTGKQHAMIIAGLRAYQALHDMTAGDVPDAIFDIATNGDKFDAPTLEEIDELCEEINCG